MSCGDTMRKRVEGNIQLASVNRQLLDALIQIRDATHVSAVVLRGMADRAVVAATQGPTL